MTFVRDVEGFAWNNPPRNNYIDDLVHQKLQQLKYLPWDSPPADHNYLAWEPGYLIDHIEKTHHRFVRIKTDEIAAYAARVARVHGKAYPENTGIYNLFVQLSGEMLEHLEAEEKTVFPLIKEIYRNRTGGRDVPVEVTDELRRQLDLMVEDHENAGRLMKRIRELSHDFTPPQGACATYTILYQNLEGFEEDLHKHVHLENNILFKKAEKHLFIQSNHEAGYQSHSQV